LIYLKTNSVLMIIYDLHIKLVDGKRLFPRPFIIYISVFIDEKLSWSKQV